MFNKQLNSSKDFSNITEEQEKRFLEMEGMLRRYNDSLNTKRELPAPQSDIEEFKALRDWQNWRIENEII